MNKKRMLCLVLALCAVLLTACQQQKETFPNQPQAAATDAPAVQSESQSIFDNARVTSQDYDDGSYDPASEEGGDEEYLSDDAFLSADASPAPTMNSEYAGATPVLIDPIDKPTATPLPTLSFTYTTYEASTLHMTFDAPNGWLVEESSDTFTLTNPDPSMDFAAQLIIRAVPVAKQYSKTELTKEINGMLSTIKEQGFTKFEPSKTAGRVFLNSDGIYANYNGTLESGVKMGGRIIASCVNKTLYILHVTFPQGYRDFYIGNLYDKFRHTVKLGGTTTGQET